MLEEKNDNLPQADGNTVDDSLDMSSTENQEITNDLTTKETTQETENSGKEVVDSASTTETTPLNSDVEEINNSGDSPVEEVIMEKSNESENKPFEEVVAEVNSDSVIKAIDEVNAEESEDETLKSRHDIPMLDYEAMSMEQMIEELHKLISVDKIMSVREHVEELKKSFLSKYTHFIDEKKEQFYEDNPEGAEDFQYDFPLKNTFDELYNQFRDKKSEHFQSIQDNLKSNLKNRLAIVDELKNLIQSQESMSATLKKFNDIRDKWKIAGPIPKDKYNHVWNNYHFHLENFYDILHLDREIRDLDFKNNLEQKQKIIDRVEELLQEEDINKAFRELQDLHRIWKEDIGPVSREYREEVWEKFSELTRKMHDKRESFFEQLRQKETENLNKKQEIITQIEAIALENVDSHSAWQKQIKKIEDLRDHFFSIGKVPSDVNEDTWDAFKNAVRKFNISKNNFYKEIKKEQNENLIKKQALVDKANELKDSTDFANTTPLMKQIQVEWKNIGHVPRKVSDKLWSEFRKACNQYFENLKEQKNQASEEELAAFENKKDYLASLKSFEMSGDYKTDLAAIKAHIEAWKAFGKVPFGRRHIEGKFNKILDVLFEKLSSSKKENEMSRFADKLDHIANTDKRKLNSEKIFIIRKIDEVQHEIFQLENNIQFFANAGDDNPMVKEVHKNIERHKNDLATWKEKLKQLNSFESDNN